ncbi:MAG: WhiB family transcriptional regulator [Streptomycetaceae bacterium]|nr:WhiB family transcriptional regulator [Streptomycetaceae bacterium]
MGWMARAACRHASPELFQDSESGAQDSADARHCLETALRMCARCPVRLPCVEWALETGQPQGVWGGCTTAERRAIRRAGRRADAARRVTHAA